MGVYLRPKFQFSSIILTSFRQEVILPPPPPPHPTPPPTQNKPKAHPDSRLGLKEYVLKCVKE